MIEILKMESTHIPQIANLEKLCFSDPWSESVVSEELDNQLSLWLVAVDGDCVVGYVGSQSVLGESDMMNIAVAPNYRRQGVAAALIEELVRQLKAGGNHSLTLEVRLSNYGAIKLYEKLGFVQVGRRPYYYRNPKEDALILCKEWKL